MKIYVLTNDGSPLGVTEKTIWGDSAQIGVGGAELALLTMCSEFSKLGHEVVLFNDPREANASSFEQRPIHKYDPKEACDVLIVFRSPNLRMISAEKCLKVWWSTDQYSVGNYGAFRPFVDKVVCISPFHVEYFREQYKINDAISIDLPVRLYDYENKNIERVKNRFIFTSVPDRGLGILLDIWQKIKQDVQDASLVITSDYRLWGAGNDRGNTRYISQSMVLEDVEFLSAVPRQRLIEEQLKADIHLYPCIYEELFCIAVAESQVAGVIPVTSDFGALRTTNMGRIILGNPRDSLTKQAFIKQAVEICKTGVDDSYRNDLQKKAIERFDPKRILKEWENKVFNG